MDKLGTALSYYTYAESKRQKGEKPIYYTDTVYTNQMGNISTAVKGAFTDRRTGLAKDGQEEAMMNAENYMIKSIVEFEMNYAKDNNGKLPSPQDRFKFMESLGQVVTSMFANQTTAYPDALTKPFTEIEQEIEKSENEAKVKTTAIETAMPNVVSDIQISSAVDTITSSIQENLPSFQNLEVNNDLNPLNNLNEQEYVNNFVIPYTVDLLRNMIPDNIAGYKMDSELYTQLLTSMPQDTLDTIITNMAQATGLRDQQVANIVKNLFTTYNNVSYVPPATGVTENQTMESTKVVKPMPNGGNAKKNWIKRYGETHNPDGTPKLK